MRFLYPLCCALKGFTHRYVSSCTCDGEDHPGPSNSKGRGVPEIDILEVEKNKTANSVGQVVSQSAQFAPFTHDYLYSNDTTDEYTIYNPLITRANDYRGSAVSVPTVVFRCEASY